MGTIEERDLFRVFRAMYEMESFTLSEVHHVIFGLEGDMNFTNDAIKTLERDGIVAKDVQLPGKDQLGGERYRYKVIKIADLARRASAIAAKFNRSSE